MGGGKEGDDGRLPALRGHGRTAAGGCHPRDLATDSQGLTGFCVGVTGWRGLWARGGDQPQVWVRAGARPARSWAPAYSGLPRSQSLLLRGCWPTGQWMCPEGGEV